MIVTLLLSLIPIALLIALGSGLKRHTFITESFWPQAERLGYYILLPSLFLHSLATANLTDLPVIGMVMALVLSTLTVACVFIALRCWVPVSDPAFTSVFQGGIRFNNYVGVSAAVGLFGTKGVALAAVANAAIVPTVNILCVLVFTHYCNKEPFSIRNVLKQLALNPLVAACFFGIFLQVTGWRLPDVVKPVFQALGQASLPLGLLCVGAALNFSAARKWIYPVIISSLVKFTLMPLATLLACRMLGLQGSAAMAALLFQTLPTASSSYIMARQLGGDAPLMAGIIAAQTLLAGLALPMTILCLEHALIW